MKQSDSRVRRALLFCAALACAQPGLAGAQPSAAAPEKAVMFIGWRAEAEWGGFFQAVAKGIYRKHGLDVEIRLGNPQSNPTPMLLAGRVDFTAGSSGTSLNAAREGAPLMSVAAIFQKDPRVLIAHPNQGVDRIEQIKDRTVLVGALGMATFWPYLRGRFGFTDDQVKPYTFSLAPFLADKKVVQQGLITNEPLALKKAGVENPVSFLLADYGWDPYMTTIVTTRDNVEKRPQFVQKFVDASIEGWYSYLYDDPSAGNELIKRNNPEMTDEQIAFAISAMKERGLIDSGDAKRLGIGAMTDARWDHFYQSMVDVGVLPKGLDVRKAYTLRFVNKKVGMR
ncbi:ABC transporter substrate-binding protein [Pigmentiphaga kullae]|uniref:NitT/TauT family transport system substrate-binding protein n=1 Tax=Pigmentiphaga kullae TaxID=151784 RepID=A0A4Q7NM62_9BURK|nr:ABC transporter substrate-binding protein [Pigmentiphaga kullae]RZS86264.1 NitT/TauT family transport system substrate-binding protein [Pigmentiphaga kullae]